MNPAPETIAICDDDAALRRMLSDHLSELGYEILQAANAKELKALLEGHAPDLILLDVRMPGEDGLTALRDIRIFSKIPIIMLTAASGVVDKVVGLEMGADDYLVKPVDLRELQARIKATLRRSSAQDAEYEARDRMVGRVTFGACQLDLDSARLYGPDGVQIPLTAMEFSLLRVFAENRGRILSRDQLLERAHDRSWQPFDRSIDLRISRIRRKIETHPAKPQIIRTVRGIGYIFD